METTYEKEIRAMATDGLLPSERRLRALSSDKPKYSDIYGDLWVREDAVHVTRLSDGNIGNWYGGNGLEEITTS